MNFFLQIHRSIVDPSFYLQVTTLPAKKVFSFLFIAISLSVLIGALGHTFRIVENKNGLPAILPTLFPDMKISSRGMVSSRETPYVVNPAFLSDLVSVLFNMSRKNVIQGSDSTLVVDEKRSSSIEKKSSIRFLLTADSIYVRHGKDEVLSKPYSILVSDGEILKFNKKGISEYLRKRILQLLFISFIMNLAVFVFIIVISIFFLSFAAFIFRVGQNCTLKTILKIVSFALSPIIIERMLSSLVGVGITWIWHVAFFISLIIVYRANKYLTLKRNTTPPGAS